MILFHSSYKYAQFMSKKRRTRKEKMAAVARRDFGSILVSPQVNEIKIETPIAQVLKTQTRIDVRSYTYVASDIRNTLTITLILIVANIAIFAFLKLKLINLFGIVF